MKVGFIGLGRMGQGMARNLLKSGVQLVVFDVSPEATQQLVDAGEAMLMEMASLARRVARDRAD